MSTKTHLHFVGIGGIGMSGIAAVFAKQGYEVTGSDIAQSEITDSLKKLGIKIYIGHRPENITLPQVVVMSTAVSRDNPEIQEARRKQIPVIPRAEMLGELMRGKTGLAVAGTHGKTTVTSMLAMILSSVGLDPTIVIGGKVDALGGNAKSGEGEFVVAEADESDGSFLHLSPTYGIITNIDNDHIDHFGSMKKIDEAFKRFVAKLPFYGSVIVCGDDPGVKRITSDLTKPYVTYGFGKNLDFRAEVLDELPEGSRYSVFTRDGTELGQVELNVPGRHNVLNSLSAVVLCLKLGVSFSKVVSGLKEYRGVQRRFQVIYQNHKLKRAVVDDYAHHPTEIQATLQAARTFWDGRIVSVFQPHRYSRTVNCRKGFLSAFLKSDVVYVSDIFAAGEEPIPGVDSEALVEEMKSIALPGQEIYYVGSLDEINKKIQSKFADGDLVLFLGAGSITRAAKEFAQLCPQESSE